MNETRKCIYYNPKTGYYTGTPPGAWEKRENIAVLITELNSNYVIQSFLKLEDLAKKLNKNKTTPVKENVNEFIDETDGSRFFNKIEFNENGTLVNLLGAKK